MEIKRIVITGGPGTGKTSIINALKAQNFHCFDEIIRELTLEAKNDVDTSAQISNPIAFVNNPMDFNTKLLNGRINQFTKANNELSFFDRGIPDVLAYMRFFNQEYDDTFTLACEKHKYNCVFLLPPWEAIYKCDNERFETFDEAVKIHDYLKQIYTAFKYKIIEVPFGNIEARTNYIINSI